MLRLEFSKALALGAMRPGLWVKDPPGVHEGGRSGIWNGNRVKADLALLVQKGHANVTSRPAPFGMNQGGTSVKA